MAIWQWQWLPGAGPAGDYLAYLAYYYLAYYYLAYYYYWL